MIYSATESSISKQTNLMSKSLGKEDFLLLFTSQLKYQDPLKPLESTEFTAQMAQFSSLEQLFNLNNNVEKLILYQQSLNNGIATGLLGKTVKTVDDVVAKVTGISFSEGITYLLLENGQKINLGQIKEILETI
jgi:flagellar basal-body rod modification protein FlgD